MKSLYWFVLGAQNRKKHCTENDLPMVGIVVTISPSFNLYKMVVFPAASRPTENGYACMILRIMTKNMIKRFYFFMINCAFISKGLTHENSHLLFAKQAAK